MAPRMLFQYSTIDDADTRSTNNGADVGDDTWGSMYKEHLQTENIDTTNVLVTKGHATGIAQTCVADNADSHIVIVADANNKLSKKDILARKDILNNAEILIMQLEIPIETVLQCLNVYKGISILNATPAIRNPNKLLLTLPTIFCVNEIGASIFTNRPVSNVKEAKVAVDTLLKSGCNSVILTLGPEGAIYGSRSSPKPVQIYAPKVDAVHTTGASDEFIGSLAYLLTYRPDIKIEHAIEVSNHVAAFSITKHGTQRTFLNAEHLDDLLQKMKLK